MAEKTRDNISSFNTFCFVGTLSKPDDYYSEYIGKNKSDIVKINFMVKCGRNKHFVESVAFRPKDGNKVIHLFKKDGTRATIPFKDRINVDTGDLGRMHNSYSEMEAGKTRFAHGVDFIEKVKSVFSTERYKGRKYKITGSVENEGYTDKNGNARVITKYIVSHIEEVPMETEDSSTANLKLYLLDNCLTRFDDVAILEGEAVRKTMNGYESATMKVELPLGDKADRAFEMYQTMYRGNSEQLNKAGLKVDVINGTQDVDFTEDMLTDEERDRIELGIDTFETIKATKGSGVGERERKFVRIRDLQGYSEIEETVLTLEDIGLKKVEFIRADELPESPSEFGAIDDDDLPF